MNATVQTLRDYIEHAPKDPGPLAPSLAGWRTTDGWFVCARCAGRIFARGCRLPGGSEPEWFDRPNDAMGRCCCCETVVAR